MTPSARRLAGAACALSLAALLVAPSPAGAAGPRPISITASGANGAGTSLVPGIPCDEGGSGDTWHYDYAAELPAGRLSATQPAELRLHVDLHADQAASTPTPAYTDAFLAGDASQAVIADPRGAVRLALRSGTGTCTDRPIAFDGTTATGDGTWEVVSGSGAYREATGTGPFELQADVAPGADNPFSVTLGGNLDVLDPGLTATTVRSFWGNLGIDYLHRVVTVVYRFTNPGPGDAYGVRVTEIKALTAGVTPRRAAPLDLGDLAAGESVDISVAHHLGLLGPCQLLILNCHLSTQFTVAVPDALDEPTTFTRSVGATAPNLPPPL